MIIGHLFLLCALAGLISCTGFLALLTLAMLRFRRRQQADSNLGYEPPVSLLKPLCGLEHGLEANLTSFFEQDYPEFEIIFGVRHADDPALAVARAVHERYPHVGVKFVLAGEPDRPNAKVCSLEKMCAEVAHDYLVISDSDVQVAPDYVRAVIGPLRDRSVGLVTCVYRGVPAGGLWSRLEVLGMSVEMTSGVIVANLLEGMKFALGPTMAIRRDVLAAIGGVAVLADYCADDYVLGNKVYEFGRTVVLSGHIVDHVARHRSFKSSLLHQLRWMKSTRFSRPKGHLGSALTFAMPFGLLGLVAGFWAGHPLAGSALLGGAVVNRLLMSVVVGWGVTGDRRSLRDCWLYPVRDFMGFCFWCASYAGRDIVWRNQRYQLEAGGKMVRIDSGRAAQAASAAVAVDNLA